MSAVAIDVDRRPGLDPRRLVGLMTEAVRRCALDLSGRVVLTEAASGAYVVTPILAALADASRVIAVTRDSRHGSAAHVTARTRAIAAAASVAERIEIHPRRSADALRAADIVTNSGHVRPLDARAVGHMRPGAAISLMYEAWELRPADVDLDACRRRGVRVGGVNEAHPAVDLLSFLGVMAVKLLTDAGVSVYRSRLLLLCDNPFASFIENGLVAVGARVDKAAGLDKVSPDEGWDAILVALRPRRAPVLGNADARRLARWAPGAVVAQYWGDVDRAALRAAGVPVWPPAAPAPGHMGILPSAVGPEPIVRLQAGGLKVGEVLARAGNRPRLADLGWVQPL